MKTLYSIALLISLLLYGCFTSPEDEVAGGSDTETGFSGIILNPDNSPAQNVPVKLIPGDFDPFKSQDTSSILLATTDSLGKYHFAEADTTMIFNVLARSGEQAVFKAAAPTRDTLGLMPTNTLQINLTYVDYIYGATDSTHAYFTGTPITVECDSVSIINNIPLGVSLLSLNNAKNEKGEKVLPDLNAAADSVVVVDVQKYQGQPYQIQ